MLNISSSTAVSWPTPASTAVAPLSPVVAVQPVQAGAQGGSAQMGFGRERHAAEQQTVTGRAAADGRTRSTEAATPSTAGVPAPHDPVAQRRASQEAEKAAEQQQVKDKSAVEHLQKTLYSMWEASAAVVERALGIEPSDSQVPGTQSDTAPDLSAVAAATIPRKRLLAPEPQAKPALEPMRWPVMPEAVEGEGTETVEGLLPTPIAAEVVAYDENGNSSLAPLEAGSIIDQRV